MPRKLPYISGPLTELIQDPLGIIALIRAVANFFLWLFGCRPFTFYTAQEAKRFYEQLAKVFIEPIGEPAFLPHKHYDPIVFAHFTSEEVDEAERRIVCKETFLLVVVAVSASWGGGIEVEMAHRSGVPVVVLYPKYRRVSRLLKGNPAVQETIEYEDHQHALRRLGAWFAKNFNGEQCQILPFSGNGRLTQAH